MRNMYRSNSDIRYGVNQLQRRHAQSKIHHLFKRRNDAKFKIKEVLKVKNSRLKKKHIFKKGGVYLHKIKGDKLPSNIIY